MIFITVLNLSNIVLFIKLNFILNCFETSQCFWMMRYSLYAATVTIKMCTEGIVQGQSALCYLVLHFIRYAVKATNHFSHWFFYIHFRVMFMEKCFHSSMPEGHFTSHRMWSTEYWSFFLRKHSTSSFTHVVMFDGFVVNVMVLISG